MTAKVCAEKSMAKRPKMWNRIRTFFRRHFENFKNLKETAKSRGVFCEGRNSYGLIGNVYDITNKNNPVLLGTVIGRSQQYLQIYELTQRNYMKAVFGVAWRTPIYRIFGEKVDVTTMTFSSGVQGMTIVSRPLKIEQDARVLEETTSNGKVVIITTPTHQTTINPDTGNFETIMAENLLEIVRNAVRNKRISENRPPTYKEPRAHLLAANK